MLVQDIINRLESLAPLQYQESYDNSGLLIGSAQAHCTGILCTLDVTEQVVDEAIEKGCNVIVAHHPVIFKGLKSITGKHYVERIVIKAIQHNLSIYAIHTNLDNVSNGVNGWFAKRLGLNNCQVLMPKEDTHFKLISYVPVTHTETLLQALFNAGAGNIGEYSEASFRSTGIGTFKGSTQSNPTIGKPGVKEEVAEDRIEVILPRYLEQTIISTLQHHHPYEEVAYELVPIVNKVRTIGAGLVGTLPNAVSEEDFLQALKQTFGCSVIKHTALTGHKVKKVAVCGGAGSFLIPSAIRAGAQFLITADLKYHDFFEADGRLVVADIGHWESEHYVADELFSFLTANFPNFAVLKSTVNTNPVRYF